MGIREAPLFGRARLPHVGLSVFPGGPMAASVSALGSALAGRHQIERELGCGGMAMVHLATNLRHCRPVALEALHAEATAAAPAPVR